MLFLTGCINNPFREAPNESPAKIQKHTQEARHLNMQKVQALQPIAQQTTSGKVSTEQPASAPQPVTDLWVRLRHAMHLPSRHKKIDQEIRHWQQFPPAFTGLLKRSEPYLYYILSEVEARDMPAEIALLPAVESSFQPFAYSPDGAAGLWQFMPATGRQMDLQQDWWWDARRDPILSTQAALDHLQALHQRFNHDWLLALAAYNAGPGKVSRAIKKNKRKGLATDFWSLDLPAETDRYVPRLMALSRIIKTPDQFGLAIPELQNAPYFELVETGDQIDMQVAAEIAGISPDELSLLNAGFNQWATRPDGPHRLLVPIEKASGLKAGLQALPADKRLRWKRHSIQKGETLGHIARRYRVEIAAIKRVNEMDSNLIRAGRHLMIPLSESSQSLSSLNTRLRHRSPKSRIRYQVRKGDSLYRIARRFKVTIADLRRWNSLPGKYLKPGQRLTVFVKSSRRL